MAHYDIFRHHLSIKFPAYGHALWDPDPGLLSTAVEIGDVGYIREGKFHRLFNVLLPANHPSHCNFGVPEYHEELTLNMENHINNCKLSRNNFCSAKVTSKPVSERLAEGPDEIPKVTFSCPTKEGAVLCLPIQAKGENTVAMADFGKWIIKHIDRWFAWVRQLGLGINRIEDIILVTGTHRTRSWTNIAFPGGQDDARATVGAKVDHRGDNIAINWQFSHERNRGTVLNCGPDGEDLPEDQCIFVRGFRVARKLKILPPRLMGAAGPNRYTKEYDEEPEVELIPIPSVPEYRDPLYILLEFIAEEAPNSDIVLVHDNDLARLQRRHNVTKLESLQPDAMLSLLRSSQLSIHEIPFGLDLSSPLNDACADTKTVLIATLSNIFAKPYAFYDPRRLLANVTPLLTRIVTRPYQRLNRARVASSASCGTRQTRTMGAQSGQGGGQPSPTHGSAFTDYSGSEMVDTPAFDPSSNKGSATSPLSQLVTEPYPQVPQLPNRHSASSPASIGGHRTSSQYGGPVSSSLCGPGFSNQPMRSPAFSGPYTSNLSAAQMPPPTPALLTRQLSYDTAGVAAPSPYVPADPRPSSKFRTIRSAPKDRVPSQIYGIFPNISTSSTRQSRPLCKEPGCEEPAFFDNDIHEQQEFCDDHIMSTISSGFADHCVTCKKMTARPDSEFCSETCRNVNAQMASWSPSTPSHRGQQTTATGQPGTQGKRSNGGEGAAAGVPTRNRNNDAAPRILTPTCSRCGHPFLEGRPTSKGYCKPCEDRGASRTRNPFQSSPYLSDKRRYFR